MSDNTPSSIDARKLAIRVRCKNGKNSVLRDINTNDSVQSLLLKLEELSQVPAHQMALLKGFPPKRINFDANQLVETLGLELQDTLIVELDLESKVAVEPAQVVSSNSNSEIAVNSGPGREIDYNSVNTGVGTNSIGDPVMSAESEGILMRHVVPSDNSYLFSAIIYCLSRYRHPNMQLSVQLQQAQSQPPHVFLRQLISGTVLSDPEKFNEAFLGKPNAEYVKWIQRRDSWGGGIELSILTEFYGVEIDVVDIQSLHISRFGEDKNFNHRVFLIYDGIHYDALYLDAFDLDHLPDEDKVRTVFSTTDASVCDMALELAREAKATHQFTDLKNFTLKCTICHELLKGQEGAQLHAKNTAHASFAETS